MVSTLRWYAFMTVLILATYGSAPAQDEPLVQLPQNWNDEIRDLFWFTDQGSQLLPYTWFLYLEDADSPELFRRPEHMEALRYITLPAARNPSRVNPDGLPIGFTRDDDTGWLGLTCAACHTNRLDYGGKHYLIEGAPTLAHFGRFFREMIASLEALDKAGPDGDKFTRFARRVLGEGYSTSAARTLHKDVHRVAEQLATRQRVNSVPAESYPDDYPGYARLDAFGNIMNQVVSVGLDDPDNGSPVNAPVSYPFLWGTPQSDVVQWNGSARNTPLIGPMLRNVGEVVGVFGQVEITPKRWWNPFREIGYQSKIRMHDLGRLERWLWDLRSPRWEDTSLPSINRSLKDKGAEIYTQVKCASCHTVVDRAHESDRYQATLVPIPVVGTDPNMDRNFLENTAKTLRLKGTRSAVLIGPLYGEKARSFELVVNAVVGVMLRDPRAALRGMHSGRAEDRDLPQFGEDLAQLRQAIVDKVGEDAAAAKATGRYKARPLTGIWATAPYLHNGSVSSLRQLLTKPEDRSPTFFVGSREFDPKNVGYVTEATPESTRFDTSRDGNHKDGHAYGTSLSDADKTALVEYLKTL